MKVTTLFLLMFSSTLCFAHENNYTPPLISITKISEASNKALLDRVSKEIKSCCGDDSNEDYVIDMVERIHWNFHQESIDLLTIGLLSEVEHGIPGSCWIYQIADERLILLYSMGPCKWTPPSKVENLASGEKVITIPSLVQQGLDFPTIKDHLSVFFSKNNERACIDTLSEVDDLGIDSVVRQCSEDEINQIR